MMKKIFMFAMAAIALASCSNNDFTGNAPEAPTEHDSQVAAYNAAFIQAFGGKIDPNQTWGFGQSTKGCYPNSNMWESDGYTIPADITEAEITKVKAEFAKKVENPDNETLPWTEFFVQHVYKGDSVYVAGNNQKVTGSDHMDWLYSYNPVGYEATEYVYNPETYQTTAEIVTRHEDHIYNFNHSMGSIQLMIESGTNQFGFSGSEDSQLHPNYRLVEIDGSYYVGFDFEASGQNPNQQVARDYVFDDWIVKIVPGKGDNGLKIKEQGRIIAEDLGNVGDFDFNDVVFDAKIWSDGSTEITLLAAGGTLDLEVAGVEVHGEDGFNVSKQSNGKWMMVNTGNYPNVVNGKAAVTFTAAEKYSSLIEIPIIVKKTDAAGEVTSYELTAKMGKAPQKICVPTNFRWCIEQKSLAEVYPGFKAWTAGDASTWAGEYDESGVVK